MNDKYQADRDTMFLAADGSMMCEAHPGYEWGQCPGGKDCAGPGMPWVLSGRMLIEEVCGVRPRPVAALIADLLVADLALRYPANGYHYCRGCTAGTHNQWAHDAYCLILTQELAVDAARAVIQRLVSDAKDAEEAVLAARRVNEE